MVYATDQYTGLIRSDEINLRECLETAEKDCNSN